MTSSLHKHETKPGKAFQLMSTKMKFSNCREDFQVIRSLEGWRCINPLGKLHIPLTSHIINDEGFINSRGVIGEGLTYRVVYVFLPLSRHVITVIVLERKIGHTAPLCRSPPQNEAQKNHV
jgi:hypothetical protein